jgi:hypothetical protein
LEAELVKKFLVDNPYFRGLFDELAEEYDRQIRGLDPLKKDEWAILQAKRMSLYEPINRMEIDIILGRQAHEMMEKGKT